MWGVWVLDAVCVRVLLLYNAKFEIMELLGCDSGLLASTFAT